ncbi:efflux RND transporter periplasmic adaptor subunit [Aestuariibacter halophilus]|uniref:Efflux RND transporter periplasmic adaptor subunit n=1 Tax=Fluctibacter halophilus TaxID=226011 RepID=A0ABS8GAE0_9ALTE|nr:efflux RND transporter periplasmic adaptor subunit [Aestuariibacter halophilus]MCC2617557.1 efflux RND transporter periplasmic adaptor subunit [Aestuariibacter halophilus]
MKSTLIKVGATVGVLVLGVAGMSGIKASADKPAEKEPVDTRPTVKVESIIAGNHPVTIHSYGEVMPLESTQLAAQVSGEVVEWNPDFVPGGLVERGEVLFSIEKDAYEAALLQAQADLSQAQANLIEEQARADVAKREAKTLPSSKVTDLYLRKPQLLSAQAAVKSAQARLKIAQRDLNNTEIVAPYDALVVSRDFGVGQYVNQGAMVAELHNVEAAEITISIAGFDTEFLPDNLYNTPAIVQNKGLNSFSREGRIVRDLGVVDQATRMTQLVVRINDPYGLDNQQPALKFGSYVEVDFAGREVQNAYRLPQELVTNRRVWIVGDDNTLQPKSVQVVREQDQYFLINKGLQNDDQVVLTLPEYPQKGMEVKIKGEELVAQQDQE